MPRPSDWGLRTSSPVIILSGGPRPRAACAPTSSTRQPVKPAGTYEGALLIAADGIHSAVREKLYPQEGPPIWNGRILWRGITAGEAFLTGRTMIMAGHEILKFVCYPISKQADASGKHQINWVAERHMPPTYQWRREDYNRTAKREEFLPWFKDWKFDWLDVPGLIENCPKAYEYPLVDRDPIPQWTFGRVTLMGDAAHPMYPIGSNGASQAILDARVLTREILAHGPTNAALLAYEAERRPATTDLVMLNRRNGPEQVMQMVEERAPDGFGVVTDVLSQQELEDIAANYKRVAGFQVEALNAKPPIVTMPGKVSNAGCRRRVISRKRMIRVRAAMRFNRPARIYWMHPLAPSRARRSAIAPVAAHAGMTERLPYRLRGLDQTGTRGRGGEHRAIFRRQPALDERNRLAELGHGRFAGDRARLCGRQKIHRHGDGRGVEFSLGHGEHRRTHGVVEHRREDAALDEAGRIAEVALAVKADPDPAVLRAGIEQVPAKQFCAGRRCKVVECGHDHARPPFGPSYRRPAASMVSAAKA